MDERQTIFIDWGDEEAATRFRQQALKGDDFEVQQEGGRLTITADAYLIEAISGVLRRTPQFQTVYVPETDIEA